MSQVATAVYFLWTMLMLAAFLRWWRRGGSWKAAEGDDELSPVDSTTLFLAMLAAAAAFGTSQISGHSIPLESLAFHALVSGFALRCGIYLVGRRSQARGTWLVASLLALSSGGILTLAAV